MRENQICLQQSLIIISELTPTFKLTTFLEKLNILLNPVDVLIFYFWNSTFSAETEQGCDTDDTLEITASYLYDSYLTKVILAQ